MSAHSLNNIYRKNSVSKLAFGFAFFSLVLGVCFCMVKSPSSLSRHYMGLAAQSLQLGDAAAAQQAIEESLKYNPTSKDGWKILSQILQQNGDGVRARRAMEIAHVLENNKHLSNPVYAMPAELRLSFLAVTDRDIR
jgi:Tfp pilus assembly protein PilF